MNTDNTYFDNKERLLKGADVARILNISRAFAYRLMQNGEIPTVCIGSAKRVRMVDLDNYINNNLISSDA